MTTAPNRPKLTKSYIDKLSPSLKDEFHWDGEVKGFGLRITPRGKITFIVQGRVDGSESAVRLTIGAYGVFTVEQARDDARELLRSMRRGIDPRDAKKADDAMRVTCPVRSCGRSILTTPANYERSSNLGSGLPRPTISPSSA